MKQLKEDRVVRNGSQNTPQSKLFRERPTICIEKHLSEEKTKFSTNNALSSWRRELVKNNMNYLNLRTKVR